MKAISIKNRFRYIGGVKYGKKEGFGIQKFNDNSKYSGTFRNDVVEGIGKFRFNDGNWIHGKIKKFLN